MDGAGAGLVRPQAGPGRQIEDGMSDQASEQVVVAAPVDRCFAVASDFERYPDWAPDIKECHVLARDDQGRGARVAFRTAAMGRSASYILEYNYASAPVELSWRLLEGNIMRVLDEVWWH